MADSCRASRRARVLTDFDSRLSLVVGATVTFVVAILFDVLAGEHPTHTLALALVVLVVAGLRLWLGGRR